MFFHLVTYYFYYIFFFSLLICTLYLCKQKIKHDPIHDTPRFLLFAGTDVECERLRSAVITLLRYMLTQHPLAERTREDGLLLVLRFISDGLCYRSLQLRSVPSTLFRLSAICLLSIPSQGGHAKMVFC